MAELFKELEEDIKHDRWMKLLEENWKFLIAVAVTIVLGVGAASGYKGYKQSRFEDAGEKYFKAEKLSLDGNKEEANKIYTELAKENRGGFSALSSVKLAKQALEAGDSKKAVSILKETEGSVSSKSLKDILSFYIFQIESSGSGDATQNKTSFSPLEKEVMAAVLLEKGETAKAKTLLEEIAKEAPTSSPLRKRTDELLNSLSNEKK